jgi:chromate transporter
MGMALQLCTRLSTIVLALAAMAMVLTAGHAWAQPAAIVAGGLAGLALGFPPAPQAYTAMRRAPLWSLALLALFAALLALLPALAAATRSPPVIVADAFYRSGALVFGGGHVVLPLLEAETVGRGWLDQQTFLSGYGAAQALPGPLFAFGAYLGAASETGMPPLAGGMIGLVALFLPGLLLMAGALAPWRALKAHPRARGFVAGAGAAVVGVLAAAFIDPVFPAGVRGWPDGLIALAGFLALVGRTPPWLVVIGVALAGAYSSAG